MEKDGKEQDGYRTIIIIQVVINVKSNFITLLKIDEKNTY